MTSYTPYSGYATATAHFASRPPVPGVNADHITPDPEPDPFNPVPDTPQHQAGTVLSGNDDTPQQSNYPVIGQPIRHWYDGQPSVPSGETYPRAQLAMQERMMVDHSDTNTVPDSIRLYQHYSEGQANQFVVGRMPQNAGVDPGENLQYLVNGRNSYDHTNQPNPDVYTGDAPNVGRYRLGVKTNVFGLYENPIGKFGQDAQVHAYTGLHPQFPVDKEPIRDAAPYTPNSVGTDHWLPAAFAQIPSMFALPSETALTDYATVAETGGSEFVERGRL